MILRTLIAICLLTSVSALNAQTFLNGSFETNSTFNPCTYNMSNADYNNFMSDSKAFGGYQAVDIVQNECYLTDIPDGDFAVSIANNPNDNETGEAISLELDQPLVVGEFYTFTFESIAITDFGPQGNLIVGVSTSNTEFGEGIYEAATVVGVWTEFSVSFTATEAITNITVAPMPGFSSWNSVDNFNFIESCQVEGIDEQITCTPLTWIDGVTYNESTSSPQFVISGGGVNGCDSLVYLDLTILEQAFGTEVVSSCDPFTWIDGNTYDESVEDITFAMEGAAVNGCDSIVTLSLSIIELEPMVEFTNDGFICLNENATFQWYNCTNGITLLEGETNASFTPPATGNYFVEITSGECMVQSDCTFFEATNVKEVEEQIFSLFPNPSNGQFTITGLNPMSTKHIEVFSSNGELVHTEQLPSQGNGVLTLSLNLPSGLYLVQFYDGEKQHSMKVTINQ